MVCIPQRFLDVDGKFDGYFHIVVDLGAVLTARQLGPSQAVDLRDTLQRIAMELQSISVAAGAAGTGPRIRRAGRAGRVREPLPSRALRRDAAARGNRAGVCFGRPRSAHG